MINSVSYNNINNIKQTSFKGVETQEQKPVTTVTSPNITSRSALIDNYCNGIDIVKHSDTKDLSVVFEKIKGKDGIDFVNTAYTELVKYMDLEGVAPEKITWEKNEGRAIVGDYRFYNNSVVFYSDYFMKMDKASQLGIIAHELTHCKQLENMLRTEGISVERIAYAYAVSDMRAMMVNNPKIQQMHAQAKANGKEKEFMQQMVALGTMKTTKELQEAHANTLKMPKHSLNSEKGKKAQADLVAQFNYNGADMNTYNACPLEKEAMMMENKIKTAFMKG